MENKPSKIIPNPPKTLPKPSQDGTKIYPEGLLKLILAQSFHKALFWTPKKPPRSAQERPREAPDSPKPLPNGAQDPPQTSFQAIFCV